MKINKKNWTKDKNGTRLSLATGETENSTEYVKNLFNAGININIPTKTWVYLGMSITIPAIVIIATLFIKDRLAKI